MTPPVSICLTTYNRAGVLSATLDGILAQSFGDFELIISDDGSSDGTEALCREYERRDRRVRYYRNPCNLGMPGNLNSAMAKARGDYIANLHDGDLYRPDLIAQWKRALDDVAHAPFVFNGYDALSSSGEHRLCQEPFASGPIPGTHIARHFFTTATSCVWGTAMARASAYRATRPFDARFGFISDVEMWLRLACGTDVAYVREPLITVTPREEEKPHYGWPWRHRFWTIGIYGEALTLYGRAMPETADFERSFVARMRRLALRDMLVCLKHRRWATAREGLTLWRDSPDPVLRVIASLLRRRSPTPDWYAASLWNPLARAIAA